MKVSVIIPVYNLQDFVLEALESLRAQTLGEWEAVVVDDCSTDDSMKQLQDYVDARGDSRIRLFQMEQNRGVSAVRNFAVRQSKGEWIAFLDGDDAYEPTFFEKMLQRGNALSGKAAVLHCDALQCDQAGKPVGSYGPHWFDRIRGTRGLFTRNYILPSMMMCSREAWDLVGEFDQDPKIQHVEDWDWVLRALGKKVPLVHVPRKLTRWRRHDASATHQQYRQYTRAQYMIAKHADTPLYHPYVRRARVTLLRDFAHMTAGSNPVRAMNLYRRAIRLSPGYLPAYARWCQMWWSARRSSS